MNAVSYCTQIAHIFRANDKGIICFETMLFVILRFQMEKEFQKNNKSTVTPVESKLSKLEGLLRKNIIYYLKFINFCTTRNEV